MESRWTPETSKSDFKGQNSMDYDILYIIGKPLERRCLKWACIAHLESERQVMAKRRVGSQTGSLTPDHKKSRIDPIYLCVEGVQYTIEKLLMKYTTLL